MKLKLTVERIFAHVSAYIAAVVFIGMCLPEYALPIGLVYGLLIHFPLVSWLMGDYENDDK